MTCRAYGLFLFFLLLGGLSGCRSAPPTAAIGSSATVFSSASSPAPSPRAASLTPAERLPYTRTTEIFEEFARLVEAHQGDPKGGAAACHEFVATTTAELKALAAKIRQMETGEEAARYLQEIMEANAKIRSATEKASSLAEARYGVQAEAVILALNTLALARL